MEENVKKPMDENQRKPRKKFVKREKPKVFDEEVIEIRAVTKVNKGGRQRRFAATVVVGDRKGRVGIGVGKANEVPDAIRKATADATKNVKRINIIDERTISHEFIGVEGATRVLLKPAVEGKGVIAGGAVRSVLELAGIKDVVSKSLGARTKKNMAEATLKALLAQKTPEEVARLRGKKVEEILG